METTISKAQQKRNKDLYNCLEASLTRELVDFKNQYLGDYVTFRIHEIQTSIDNAQHLIDNPTELRAINAGRNKWSQLTVADLEHRIATKKKKLVHTNINSLTWLNEANDGFKTKFDNLINKLVAYQFDTRFLKVNRVGSGTYDKFSILISNKDMEVEARFIYCNGLIKIPHYRFIITKRSN